MVLPEAASCSNEVTSEIVGASRRAETRGRSDLAAEEVEETTCVKDVESERSFSRRGESVSGRGSAYCWDVE